MIEILDRHTGNVLLRLPIRPEKGLRAVYLGWRVTKDLRTADLHGRDLTEADLTGRDLSDADLTDTVLVGATYDARTTWPADFSPETRQAVRVPVDLRGADLAGADLEDVDWTGGDLRGANLAGACLRGVNLTRARLRGANVAGADLSAAALIDADIVGVRADAETRWPDGFDVTARQAAAGTEPDAPVVRDAAWEEQRILATFFDGDRLKQIPLHSDKKKIVVLRRLVRVFALGQRYTEKEVSAALGQFHEDFASLRRMLIDYRFMARTNNIYWRTWVEGADFRND